MPSYFTDKCKASGDATEHHSFRKINAIFHPIERDECSVGRELGKFESDFQSIDIMGSFFANTHDYIQHAKKIPKMDL